MLPAKDKAQTMAEVINNRVCVGLQELNGIVTPVALRQMSSRGQSIVAQRACRNTPALYYVDSLPYKYRCEVYRRYPDLQAQAQAKPFVESIEPDGDALNFFDSYTFEDGSHLSADKAEEYSNNATLLRHFGRLLDTSNAMRIKTSHAKFPKGEFWSAAASALERMSDEYPNSLPQNPRRLQEKYNQFIKQGYEVLISGKMGNRNASKVDTDEKRSVICALCAIPNGFDNEFVARYYNETADKLGWERISATTVAKYRKENGLVIDAARSGSTSFSNTHTMQIARRRPQAAMLMWSLDGWDAELYYQKRNAKGVVTYAHRKVLEVVLDPCCNFPVGYAIGDAENAELIAEALRNASNYTKSILGARYQVCQIQSDHYALKAMTPYYATIAAKVTPARVKNAKAKPIERYFGHLNETYCKSCINHSGYGATSVKGKMNAEYVNVIKKNFPDEAGVIEQLRAIIEQERASKLAEYLKFWEATPEARRLPLSEETYLLRFGKTTGNTNILEGSGVRPRIGGHKYQYDCFDVKFRELSAYLRWTLLYDESDMSRVLAVSEDGKHRFLLEEKYIQPMTLAERTEADTAAKTRVEQFNNSLISNVKEGFLQITNHAAAVIGGTALARVDDPKLASPLEKTLITDSRGQHKSRRAEERIRLLNADEPGDITMLDGIDPIEDEATSSEQQTKQRKRKKVLLEVPIVSDEPVRAEERVHTFDLY